MSTRENAKKTRAGPSKREVVVDLTGGPKPAEKEGPRAKAGKSTVVDLTAGTPEQSPRQKPAEKEGPRAKAGKSTVVDLTAEEAPEEAPAAVEAPAAAPKEKPPDAPPPKGVHCLNISLTPGEISTMLQYVEAVEKHQPSDLQTQPLMVDRGAGRLEYPLDTLHSLVSGPNEGQRGKRHTVFVRENLGVCKKALHVILSNKAPILKALDDAGVPTEGVRFYASVFTVSPGARAQDVHTDAYKDSSYYTAFLPLTDYPGQGNTEFGKKEPFACVDGAFAFGGRVPHRGGANTGKHTRAMLAIVITRHEDCNRAFSKGF